VCWKGASSYGSYSSAVCRDRCVQARCEGLRPDRRGPYANICEHCPSFHTTSDYNPVLTQQRGKATALADDATSRGWDSETERHLKLINRINDLITVADARGHAM